MKLKFQIIVLLFFMLLMVTLSSCDQNRFFEQNVEVEQERWAYNDAKTISVDVKDTVSTYDFYLNIRNTNDYPYANLYLFIQTIFPDSLYARDTIELQLANHDGRWLGEGKGKYKYSHFILRHAMHFNKLGLHEFKIAHGMRKDTLYGISDIGIRLEYCQ